VASRILFVLALCASAPASAADPALGTLFHTPEERERLDRMRRGEPESAPASVPGAPGAASAITGFVKRSDGRHTVWIDGQPVTVRGTQAAPVFDTRTVRAYSDREEESLKIERKGAR
jgi:hypothetical protein